MSSLPGSALRGASSNPDGTVTTTPDANARSAGETKELSLRRLLLVEARAFWDADPLTLAASIAFYTSLSFAPVIVLALWIIGALSPGQEVALVDQLRNSFGREVAQAAQVVIDNADASRLGMSVGGLIAIGALVVSATTAFGQLQAAINRVWHVPPPERNAVAAWVRKRAFSLGMIAAIGFLLICALVLSTVLALVLTREGAGWVVVNEMVTLLVLTAVFAGLYRFVPDATPPWRGALWGGVVTALLFEVGKWGLGFYLGRNGSADAYGGASALVLLLLWSYYSALIVLVGSACAHAMMRWRRWELRARKA